MTRRDWERGDIPALGLFLNGQEIPYPDARGQRIVDDSFLLLVNGHHEEVDLRVPSPRYGAEWALELSTAEPEALPGAWTAAPRATVACPGRSLTVLKRVEARQGDTPEEPAPTADVAEAAVEP